MTIPYAPSQDFFLQIAKIPGINDNDYWKLAEIDSQYGGRIIFYPSAQSSPKVSTDFQLQLISDNSPDNSNYFIYFYNIAESNFSQEPKKLEAKINLNSYTLTLANSKGSAAIDVYGNNINSNIAKRILEIKGDEGGDAQLILKNAKFGMKLGGNVDLKINDVKKILVSGEDMDGNLLTNPVRTGIVLVSQEWVGRR